MRKYRLPPETAGILFFVSGFAAFVWVLLFKIVPRHSAFFAKFDDVSGKFCLFMRTPHFESPP
ncbi:hypothetical protein, partial [Thermoactinomyces daqus]|uniref:hypothetical protein n=1 Tax=Thermoactinomyces daqus TaxID=1329516 RepID=UPI001F1B2B12